MSKSLPISRMPQRKAEPKKKKPHPKMYLGQKKKWVKIVMT